MARDDVGNALSPKWARVVETVLAGGTQEAQAARWREGKVFRLDNPQELQ